MSIRVRLMIRSGIPFCLVLTLATLLGYAIHTRGQYEDLDRLLVANATHAVTETTNTSVSLQSLSKAGESGGVEIVLRLYGSDGTLQDSTPGAQALPQVAPQAILQNPAGPAFDALAGLIRPWSRRVHLTRVCLAYRLLRDSAGESTSYHSVKAAH